MTLDQLKKQAKELFEKVDSPEILTEYTKFENSIEEAKKEQEELLNRNANLQKSLKEAILNSSFKKEEVKDEEPKEKTLEEIAQEVLSRKEN